MTVGARDVADALAIAWHAFTGAAADDLTGWDVPAAAAPVLMLKVASEATVMPEIIAPLARS